MTRKVFVGKIINNTASEICLVIDSDIATGSALVYNRESDKVELLKFHEKTRLPKNIEKLAIDTEKDFYEKELNALKKYSNDLFLKYKEVIAN